MRILVAEDDAALADGLTQHAAPVGLRGRLGQERHRSRERSCQDEFDLLILDLGLPKKSGLDVLRRLRARDSRLPVLILTALDGVSDRVRGLDAGADDYLAKPFELAELEARVRALTRRGMAGGPTLLQHGALELRPGRARGAHEWPVDRALGARGEPARDLPAARRAPRLQGPARSATCASGARKCRANAIEVYVHRLRKKLEPGGVRIVTVRGLGYSLEKPDHRRCYNSRLSKGTAFCRVSRTAK